MFYLRVTECVIIKEKHGKIGSLVISTQSDFTCLKSHLPLFFCRPQTISMNKAYIMQVGTLLEHRKI